MNLDPNTISIKQDGDQIIATINGEPNPVDRMARAFPRSNPDQYVSLMNAQGHEIGIIEDPALLDPASRDLLTEKLRILYFIPTIRKIRAVTQRGTGSFWEVDTDDGPREFRILGRDALNGRNAPSIEITEENGKHYRIENYWELDADSRDLISDLLPIKVLKARYVKTRVPNKRGA